MALRGEGKTYSEIQKTIGVKIPKSTLSNWCTAVILPAWYQEKIDALNKENSSKALRTAHAANRIKREQLLDGFLRANTTAFDAINFNKDVYKIILSILHLGEGAKWKSHSGLMLGSTDPNIIKLYIGLLAVCYGIQPRQLKCRVGHRADQSLGQLQRYWSNVTAIPLENFYKSIPDPRTVGKPTRHRDYMGVCVIMGGSTTIQLELEMIPALILEKIEKGP